MTELKWDGEYPPGVTVEKKPEAAKAESVKASEITITPEERALLDGYRLLTARQKARVRAMIDKLIDGRFDLD